MIIYHGLRTHISSNTRAWLVLRWIYFFLGWFFHALPLVKVPFSMRFMADATFFCAPSAYFAIT
jgi:hypothetical protein